MPLTLAFFEGLVIFLVACARLFAERAPTSDPRVVAAQALALTICGLFAFHFNDLYDLRRVRGFGAFAARFPVALLMMVLMGGVLRALAPVGPSWRALAETVMLVVLVLLPLRAALYYLFAVHPFSRRVLILGTTELAGKIVREMLAEPSLRDVVVGVADDGSAAFKPALPTLRLGSIDSLGTIIAGFEPDLIVCALAERHDQLLVRELLAPRARGVRIEDGVVAYERLTGKIAIEYAAPRAVLFSKDTGASWITLCAARTLSVVVAVLALVALSPLFLPLAFLIKMDSDGPVFFLQERVGLGGRAFQLIKFRTMHPGQSSSEWAADNGHRTTRIGRFLRRFRIDELPQFLNILRGDMNLVGPRPHPVSNVELFMENIPYYGVRCSVRPGVTGWAQIRYGYANSLQEETEKMRYDLHYIEHMSLALDVRILFETVRVVVRGGRSASLADEPAARLAPIYFGTEHSRSTRGTGRFSEPVGLREAPAPARAVTGSGPHAAPVAPAESVASIEERRAGASRGVA